MGTPYAARPAVTAGLRTGLWTVVYVAACLLGRVAVDDSSGLALIWPAVGVALLWLGSTIATSWFPVDLVVLVLATLGTGLALGAELPRLILLQISVLEALVALFLMRRLVPGIWGTGGRRMLRLPRDYGWFLVSATAAAVIGAASSALVRMVHDDSTMWWAVVDRAGRDVSALVGVGTFGLLLGGYLAERRDTGSRPAGTRPWGRRATIQLALVAAVTALVFVNGFWFRPEAPSTTFVLTLMVVWVAIAFDSLLVAGFALSAGALGAALTIVGLGPMANVQNGNFRAFIVQMFVVVLMVIGMTISLTRGRLLETIGRLERSETERGARAEELDLVIDQLDDGVAIVESGGRIVHTNSQLHRIVARGGTEAPALASGRPIGAIDLFHRDGSPVLAEDRPSARALRGEVVNAEEYVLAPGDPNPTIVQVSALPVARLDDRVHRIMLVVRDVTEETHARDTLVAFAATVAHDLNSPLTVVDGWAESLEELLSDVRTVPTEAAVPMVQHIRAGVDTMRSFVADLLAHAVARDQALHAERLSLQTVIKQVLVTRQRPGAPSPVRTGTLPDVWADRLLLQQLLDNLIGNALKYVAPGVTPEITIDAEPIGEDFTAISVCDNGIGIPEDQRELVFRSFHRADPGSRGGTGLGLSICKRIVQRHGGTIEAWANPTGQGSVFQFTLPTTEAAFANATHSGA